MLLLSAPDNAKQQALLKSLQLTDFYPVIQWSMGHRGSAMTWVRSGLTVSRVHVPVSLLCRRVRRAVDDGDWWQ